VRSALRWFQDYYGIAYPGDKVDLVALPDFAAGAMENLGCITFRESLLLVDPATSTQNERQLIADVVAHELAHMWFGDLVTMRWWNGIWLNEAFATFMEVAACDAYRPDWERWTAFGVERSGAFETDSLASTRPVEFEVRSPADCEGMFDVLTYQKGGALLRMLEQYLGAERSARASATTSALHSYANTETNDLWDAIEATSGEPVRRIMDSWIWQPGYPLVSAAVVDGSLELRQRRFRFDDDSAARQRRRGRRPALGDPRPRPHRRHHDDAAPRRHGHLAGPHRRRRPGQPIVVNAGGHGFYRVAYSGELRDRLDGRRCGDVHARAVQPRRRRLGRHLAGRMSADTCVISSTAFADEREYTVWQAIAKALRGLGRLVDDGPARDHFRRRCAVSRRRHSSRWAIPPTTRATSPANCVACSSGWSVCSATTPASRPAVASGSTLPASDPTAVDPELISAATTVVAATGDADTYEQMRERFLTGSTPQEQLRHLYALAEFDDEALVLATCEFAMSSEVRSQNAPFLLRAAIANRHHGPAAWAFVRDHWDEALDRFPSNTIVRMVDSITYLSTPELVDDTSSFFADHPIEQAAKTLEQVLERQRVNIHAYGSHQIAAPYSLIAKSKLPSGCSTASALP
jgi:puromycin-sensitive aminopeptidase